MTSALMLPEQRVLIWPVYNNNVPKDDDGSSQTFLCFPSRIKPLSIGFDKDEKNYFVLEP